MKFDHAVISGQLLAGLLLWAYSSPRAASRAPLFGHVERRVVATDAHDSLETATLIITSAGHPVRGPGAAIGAVSCRRNTEHILSFADARFLGGDQAEAEAEPKQVLLFVTQRGSTPGLDAVEYTLFHGRRAVEVAVDNIVDSTGEFAVLRDLFSRNRPSFNVPANSQAENRACTSGAAAEHNAAVAAAPTPSPFSVACLRALSDAVAAFATLSSESTSMEFQIVEHRRRIDAKRKQLRMLRQREAGKVQKH